MKVLLVLFNSFYLISHTLGCNPTATIRCKTGNFFLIAFLSMVQQLITAMGSEFVC